MMQNPHLEAHNMIKNEYKNQDVKFKFYEALLN